jgi:hypothetical protein
MNVGFDLDKIFINTPPVVPGEVIEWFYKEKTSRKLRYRTPSRAEQIIRIISHYPIFRLPIRKNIDYIKNLNVNNKNKYFLISSRFNFLKTRTDKLIKRFEFDKIFNGMYFNYSNLQPHEFKSKMIKKLNIDMFVDDDLQLLEYLTGQNVKTKFFWLNGKISKPLMKNLFAIKHISEMFTPLRGI